MGGPFRALRLFPRVTGGSAAAPAAPASDRVSRHDDGWRCARQVRRLCRRHRRRGCESTARTLRHASRGSTLQADPPPVAHQVVRDRAGEHVNVHLPAASLFHATRLSGLTKPATTAPVRPVSKAARHRTPCANPGPGPSTPPEGAAPAQDARHLPAACPTGGGLDRSARQGALVEVHPPARFRQTPQGATPGTTPSVGGEVRQMNDAGSQDGPRHLADHHRRLRDH